jgi:phosphatidylglycerophosphatase A
MSLRPLPRRTYDLPLLIATWFGCGFAPIAPGTVGSLAALIIAIALHLAYASGRGTFLLMAMVLLIPGIWSAGIIEKRENMTDPHIVVVDEVIGQWVTLAGTSTLNWKSWFAAFLLFRALDVWKPAPARQFESLPGGIGIVADDLMAGIYGALAIFLLDRFHFF